MVIEQEASKLYKEVENIPEIWEKEKFSFKFKNTVFTLILILFSLLDTLLYNKNSFQITSSKAKKFLSNIIHGFFSH